VTELRAGNWLDTWLLIPGYIVLFVTLVLLIAHGMPNAATAIVRVGLAITAVVVLADLIENYHLERIVSSLHDPEMVNRALAVTTPAAFIKWGGLGTLLVGLGAAAALQDNWRRRLTFVLLAVGILMLAPILRHAVDRLSGESDHSGRSASMTSTRDARAAGTSDASTAATTRIIAAAAIGTAPGIRTSSM
jgi:multisubunit Na+/H+ antiporter MnhG subunit